MRQFLLAAIRFYQRYVSPHKGFSCAYRVHTGRCSCSAFGYRAVRMHGVVAGLALIRARTQLCGEVYRHFIDAVPAPRRLAGQRGVCDVSCDLPCDANCGDALDVADCACDVADLQQHCASRFRGCACANYCPCDCSGWDSNRRRRRDGKQRYVHIPPNAWRQRR